MKNCHACQHLEYFDDTNSDGHTTADAGWGCNKRAPHSEREERVMIANLKREPYRNRYKRCFEARPQTNRAAAVGAGGQSHE